MEDGFRAAMPVARQWAYLDHAAVAPLPAVGLQAIQRWCLEATEQGDVAWPRWNEEVERVRTRAAKLLNAQPDEIALVPSTTAGINLVADGFPWREGDNVVTLENEFPSNLYPWLNLARRGVETRQVQVKQGRVDLEEIARACDARTRLISASWVGYASGWRLDVAALAELAHRRGALLMLDAIQGLGVFSLDVEAAKVDFAAADGHKWLLGPEGAGIFFVRRDLLEFLNPLGVGWHSAERPFDFSSRPFVLRKQAARYEGGTRNTPGFLALGASLGLLEQQGYGAADSRIADRVLSLAEETVGRIVAAGGKLRYARQAGFDSGIVTFDWPGYDPAEVRKRCLQAGVVLSCRGGGVRVSLHGYNNQDDIRRLLESLPPPR